MGVMLSRKCPECGLRMTYDQNRQCWRCTACYHSFVDDKVVAMMKTEK